jgi:hypothetical protein
MQDNKGEKIPKVSEDTKYHEWQNKNHGRNHGKRTLCFEDYLTRCAASEFKYIYVTILVITTRVFCFPSHLPELYISLLYRIFSEF